jgi:hypothetical protein
MIILPRQARKNTGGPQKGGVYRVRLVSSSSAVAADAEAEVDQDQKKALRPSAADGANATAAAGDDATFSQLFFGHDTWDTYSSMVRRHNIFRRRDFRFEKYTTAIICRDRLGTDTD